MFKEAKVYIDYKEENLLVSNLGVVPSLLALCIAHWFTSLSAMAKYDEPGLNYGFEILCFIAIRFSFIPLCCAHESPQRTKQYRPQIE